MSYLAKAFRSHPLTRVTSAARPSTAFARPFIPRWSPELRNLASSTLPQTRTPSAIAQRLPDPERNPHRFRDFDLEGKVFVVTGGGRGLGLTLAEVLVEAGGKGVLPCNSLVGVFADWTKSTVWIALPHPWMSSMTPRID